MFEHTVCDKVSDNSLFGMRFIDFHFAILGPSTETYDRSQGIIIIIIIVVVVVVIIMFGKKRKEVVHGYLKSSETEVAYVSWKVIEMLKIGNKKSIAIGFFFSRCFVSIYYDNETEVNTTYEKPVNFIGTDSGKSVFISGNLFSYTP